MSVSGETKSYGEMIRRVRDLQAEVDRLRGAIEEHHRAVLIGTNVADYEAADERLWAHLTERP